MKNIVFIGMPGCGKSSVAKALADRLCRPYFDSDAEIEAQLEMRISEVFDSFGEDYFREQETACIRRLNAMESIVISLGGGAVLRNAELIRQNAYVIYLKRSLDSILSTLETENRPLLRDRAKLSDLYAQRRYLYENCCDATIENEKDIVSAVDQIIALLQTVEH